MFNAESFGDTVPVNWEEIANCLNAIAADRGITDDHEAENELWESYWNGDLPGTPGAKIEEDEKMSKIKIQFFSGIGNHFEGPVYYLIAAYPAKEKIYAECAAPDGASDEYGYLTMKAALIKAYKAAGGDPEALEFWYDGQEQYLAPDASADCEVYTDIDPYLGQQPVERKIVYRVYKATAEIHLDDRLITCRSDLIWNHLEIPQALEDVPAPILVGEYETHDQARDALDECCPVMDIGHPEGMGVKYIPVTGAWIAEYETVYGKDGDVLDNEYIGTWEFSMMPDPEE